MNKKLIILIFLFILVLCGVVLIVGFVLLRSNKSKDLGVTFTKADLQRVDKKYGLKTGEIDENVAVTDSKIFEGSVAVDGNFTNAEITAQIDKWYRTWRYFPVKNVQFRANEDGTVEASGVFIVDRTYPYFEYAGISRETVDKGLRYVNLFGVSELPVYVKSLPGVDDNIIDLNILAVQVGNFPVPQSIINQYGGVATDFAQKRIDLINGLDIQEMNFDAGKTYFRGTLPETTSSVR